MEKTANNGVGFCGLLTVLFVGLKLTGYIDWPWAWVLCPIWIPLAIAAVIVVVACIIEIAR